MPISCLFFFQLPWFPWDTLMATRISSDLRKITRFGDRDCRRVMYCWIRFKSSLRESQPGASSLGRLPYQAFWHRANQITGEAADRAKVVCHRNAPSLNQS